MIIRLRSPVLTANNISVTPEFTIPEGMTDVWILFHLLFKIFNIQTCDLILRFSNICKLSVFCHLNTFMLNEG